MDQVVRTENTERRFKRVVADARRELLVEATIESVCQHGHEGTSVRRIAAAAGVSPGLINHHFESLEDLIGQAYTTLSKRWIAVVSRRVEAAGASPGARLKAFCAVTICPEREDGKVIEAWMVFWTAVLNSPRLRQPQSPVWTYYRQEVSADLAQLASMCKVPDFDVERATLGLLAIVDGLWMEKSLNPDSFTPPEAARICEDWVDGQFMVAFRAAERKKAAEHAEADKDQLLVRNTGVPAGGPEP